MASCAPVTATTLVTPRPVKVTTPALAVAVTVPVMVHEPASFLDTVTTFVLLFVHVLPKASFNVTVGCWANCPPLVAGAVMSWVKVIVAALAGIGFMETVLVAGVLTPVMLNPMVWAVALFSVRLGDATPLVKVTLKVLGDAVRAVPLKPPNEPFGAAVYPDTVTFTGPLKVVSVLPNEFFTVRIMALPAPAVGPGFAAEAVPV